MRTRLTATVLNPWETEDLEGLMQTYWAHDPAPADWDNAREELIHRGVDPERWRPRTATLQPMVFDLPADANKLSGATAPIRVKGSQQGEIQIIPIGWLHSPDIKDAVVTQIRVNGSQTISGPLSGRASYEITLNDGTVLTQSYRVQGTFTPNISKTAAKGLYGFPAGIEKTATVATRQLAREASKIAHAAMNRDAGVIEFLKVHANRDNSKSAKVLLAALRETLPRVAAAAEKGMYGHKARTAKFGIQACADVRMAAGRIAASLHDRKENEHERITSFLKTHATEGGCVYSDMIVSCYPDAPKQEKTANAPVGVRGWLSLLDD